MATSRSEYRSTVFADRLSELAGVPYEAREDQFRFRIGPVSLNLAVDRAAASTLVRPGSRVTQRGILTDRVAAAGIVALARRRQPGLDPAAYAVLDRFRAHWLARFMTEWSHGRPADECDAIVAGLQVRTMAALARLAGGPAATHYSLLPSEEVWLSALEWAEGLSRGAQACAGPWRGVSVPSLRSYGRSPIPAERVTAPDRGGEIRVSRPSRNTLRLERAGSNVGALEYFGPRGRQAAALVEGLALLGDLDLKNAALTTVAESFGPALWDLWQAEDHAERFPGLRRVHDAVHAAIGPWRCCLGPGGTLPTDPDPSERPALAVVEPLDCLARSAAARFPESEGLRVVHHPVMGHPALDLAAVLHRLKLSTELKLRSIAHGPVRPSLLSPVYDERFPSAGRVVIKPGAADVVVTRTQCHDVRVRARGPEEDVGAIVVTQAPGILTVRAAGPEADGSLTLRDRAVIPAGLRVRVVVEVPNDGAY